MKIRRLEIQGFKSFAERTVLRFGDGVTGVVGPNGCGKSNIVDAIRWVMGEQSAKHLRGSGMQDVIFAGSESRGPMGMAEVTISFKNDGDLVPAEYQRSDEISVTRRLFRDGTSEYAINKVPCRLRDIHDLFMGTGIGKNAYSIIEQGRIGLIVTAKPEDRRAFIEDAAGVSRYKARRKQAERRIEATEQNLLRITDITDELGQRLESLERQAKKAEKYKSIKSELRDLELHAAAHRALELDGLERFQTGQARGLKAEIAEHEQGIEDDEVRIASALEDLSADDESLRAKETQIHEHQKALALAHNNVAFLERERKKLEERRAEAEAERVARQEERARLEAERAEATDLGQSLDASGGSEAIALDEKAVALDDLAAQIDAAEKALDHEKQMMVNALTAIAQHRNNLANLQRVGSDLEVQIARGLEAKKTAAARERDASKKAKELTHTLTDNRQLKLSLEGERAAQEELLEKVRAERTEHEAQLMSAREELMDKRSRLNSLLEIQRNYEGCNDAVRGLMRQKARDPSLAAAVHGLVADVVSADPRYEAAVEAVLGDRLQYVIVNSQSDGVASIDFLKQHASGRSSFIPLDLREDHASWAPRRPTSRPPGASSAPPAGSTISDVPGPWQVQPALTAAPEAAAPAVAPIPGAHAVETEPEADPDRRFVRALLADTARNAAVRPDETEESEALAEGGEHLPTAVPMPIGITALPAPAAPVWEADWDHWWEQELDWWPNLSAHGVCGKMVDLVKAQPGYEHVARVLMGDVVVVENLEDAQSLWQNNGHRKTLVTLSGEVLDPVGVITGGSSEGVSAGMLGQKREIKELTDGVRMLEAKVSIAEERVSTLKGRVADLEKAIQKLSKDGHQEELSIVSLERDLKRLEGEAQREENEKRAFSEEIEMLRKKRASVEDESTGTKAAVADLELQRAEAERRVAEQASETTRLKEAARSLSSQVTELKVEVAANREKRDSSKKHLERILERITDVTGRVAKLDEVVREAEEDILKIGERIDGSRDEGASLEQVLAQEQEFVAEARAQLELETAELKAQDAAIRETRKVIDGLKEALSQCAMKVREYELARATLTEQIEERYRVQLSELLIDYHLLPRQSDEHRKAAKKLRRQLDAIGPINLTAIDEFEEVSKRYHFLTGQKKDLEEAIASLRAAIRRINKTSKDRYVEAFRLVNEKFQLVFPKLFNGGRCALVMVDESDPLESGIEMLAQPPGKKLQSVNLLSGGEKALTAVALIFSIFLIKPTPFCLLDEVDAPLDEANVGRYNEMLREMSAISQFILITHNKRTMELPDRLYGVTMEEPGISKIVPVDVMTGERHLRAV